MQLFPRYWAHYTAFDRTPGVIDLWETDRRKLWVKTFYSFKEAEAYANKLNWEKQR